jgi:soluble lytic murein transglycosylase-like protein
MLGRGAGRACTAGAMILLAGLVWQAPATAGTFRFEDQAGTAHYTNVPSDPRYRRLPGFPASRVTPANLPSSTTTGARAPMPYGELIRATAERHRMDHRLVEAVVVVESGGNPRAVSRKGAQGLMQLMPQRSLELGVRNPFDPEQNVDGGVRHLRDLLQRFGGDLTLALAAYNAGEEAVRAYQGIPPYPETQEYVRRIRALYSGLPGPGKAWAVGQAPQQIYRGVASDGSVSYTNVPPRPSPVLRSGF